MAAGLDAIDVCPVEVLAEGGAVYEFEIVEGTVPEDLRREVEASLCLCADAGHEASVALVLVGVAGTVERVGAIAFLRETELPVKP